MKKAVNGILVAKEAGNAIFYIFKNGLCTEEIPLNMGEVVNLTNALGNNLAKARMRLGRAQGYAYVMTLFAAIMTYNYIKKKKEVDLCKDELELEKEINHTDTQ